MTEILFIVEEAAEGGYTARAVGTSIFTGADDLNRLRDAVRDAVRCHFEDADQPNVIRLRWPGGCGASYDDDELSVL